MKEILINIYKQEKNSLYLWLPVIFAIFVVIGFKYIIRLEYLICINIITLLFIWFLKQRKIKILFYPLLFALFGYNRAFLVVKKQQKLNILDKYLDSCIINGKIIDKKYILKHNDKYKQEITMSVDVIECNKQRIDNIPDKIILKLRKYYDKIYYSSAVVRANIFPLPKQKFQSSFNSKRYYLNNGITAIGYSAEILENSKKEKITVKQGINNFRFNFAKRIIDTSVDKVSASIIATLLTGQKNLADKDSVNNMNYSGLSHLLAISGLHMMTLISFVFFILKWFLLRFEKIAIEYNVIKISSGVSLFFTFFYMLLSGFTISAVRAYLMSSILLLGYITNRFNDGSRSVMVIMFLILLFSPESIFSVGFQLSFISVMSIMSAVKSIGEYNRKKIKTIFSKTKMAKFINYLIVSFCISLTAELATTPITIYYFNNYTFYNVFTNLIAEPIVSMIILPFSILAIFLYFLKIEFIFVNLASWFMSIILKISSLVVKIPRSILFIKSPNVTSMFFMITAILIFSLCRSKIKYVSFLFYFIGIVILFCQKLPKVIIDYDDKSIFLVKKDSIDVYNPRYSTGEIIRKLGKSKYNNITKKYNNLSYINFNIGNNKIVIDKYRLNFFLEKPVKLKQENNLIFVY